MAGFFGMSAPAAASAGTFQTTSRVNLRSEPTTESASITLVNGGTNVDVLDHNPAGWSKVTVGSSTGYIRSDFLKFSTGGSAAAFKATAGVNVRSSASTTSSVVTTVTRGASIEVVEHDPAGWSSVRVNGTTGYIRSDFLTRGGDGSAAAGSGVSAGGGTPAAETPGSDTVIATLKTTGAINMRSGASTSHSVIRTLAANTSVEVLENQANGWSRVKHNGTNGFIRSDLLSASGSSSAQPAQPITLMTTGTVNMRSGPSTSSSVIRTLSPNTSIEVTGTQNEWSSVKHNGTNGFIRTDLLSATGSPSSSPAPSSGAVIATLRTVTEVNLRSGPSTSHERIRVLPANTSVDVIENHANGWSSVKHNGTSGFIRSDLLGSGSNSNTVELIDWSVAKDIIPTGVNLNIVDVRTGITFQLRGFAKSGHLDVEPPTQADTDAILRTRNGVWSWAARPVWVTVGGRTFAAAINGMPHDVSTIRDNGMDGHICLHFNNTVTNSQSYQRDLRAAVAEAYNARPR